MASSTSGTSSNTVTFTGTSRYSQDFQNVINRALAIAGLPMTQLNQQVATLNDQYKVLQELDGKFSSLSDSVDAITAAMGSSSFNAEISDPSIAQATVTDGAMEGVYSIEVTDLGAYTKTRSSDTGNITVTDPSTENISAATSYGLTVGTKTYSITLSASNNNLYALANAINGGASGVQATVVDLGTSSGSHDYRLSLQNSKLADAGIQLDAITTDQNSQLVYTPLMTEQVRGSVATYKVDGSSQEASSDSRIVTIAPGLQVTMLAQSTEGEATDITLTRQSEPISNALQSFVNAYNAALDDVNQQRGTAGGPISGQTVVYQLRDAMNRIGSYFNGGGAIKSLADLGVTFSKDLSGHLEFNQSTLLLETLRNMGGITSFLGDGTTSGFLKAASDAMKMVEDPTRGALTTAMTANQTQVINNNSRIAAERAKIDQLQTQLTRQMAAADALISAMEQHYTVISNLFQAMNPSSKSDSNQNSLA